MNKQVYMISAAAAALVIIVLILTGPLNPTKISAPPFTELYTKLNSSSFTAKYIVTINFTLSGSSSNYSIIYSQLGRDRVFMRLGLTTPLGNQYAYIVATHLPNGSFIQCIYAPSLNVSRCEPLPESSRFTVMNLYTPSVKLDTMRFAEKKTLLNLETYCYTTTNNSTLGNILGSSAGFLAALPVTVNAYVCLTDSGIPLLIDLSIYGSLTGGSPMVLFTSSTYAYSIQPNTYLTQNETYILNQVGITHTS